jgi:hypothetical protein
MLEVLMMRGLISQKPSIGICLVLLNEEIDGTTDGSLADKWSEYWQWNELLDFTCAGMAQD